MQVWHEQRDSRDIQESEEEDSKDSPELRNNSSHLGSLKFQAELTEPKGIRLFNFS